MLLYASYSVSKLTRESLLTVIIEKKFTFGSHISAVFISCIYHIQYLHHILITLICDLDSAQLLATVLLSIRLDYYNSLLHGITDTDLTKLQYVQNWLARLVTNSPPLTRSVPLLCSLHWLSTKFGILFKITLLTYKILREKEPVYLHSMLAACPRRHRCAQRPVDVTE